MTERTQRRWIGARRAAALSAVAVAVGIIGALGVAQLSDAASSTVVKVTTNKTWGPILTLGNGDTLYRLTADKTNQSVCSGPCAKVWPPALLAAGQQSALGQGVKGLGTITRPGGKLQITFDGIPLYLYIGDHAAGQANGNIKDKWGQWWVVNPASPHATPTASKSSRSSSGSSSGSSSSSSGNSSSGGSSSSSGSGSGSGSTNTTAGAGGGGVAY